MPARPTPLVGRQHDLIAAEGQLRRDDVRLLTLTGPPGIGKTRLAVAVVESLMADYAHGVAFVDLAPLRDPPLVLSAIAQTLGVREQEHRALADDLGQFLWDKHLILVLDNFEQLLPAAVEVAALLAACPSLKVLVTSRTPLHVRWEYEFPVPPLALPDLSQSATVSGLERSPAVALFVARARATRPDFVLTPENAGAVAAICVRLDGLPLAIELAAAHSKVFSPRAILSHLDDWPNLLAGGAPDLPARHKTMRDAINWSYNLLDADERRVFQRLGVFVGGFSFDAAATVCSESTRRSGKTAGEDPREHVIVHPPLPALASLVDQSLVRVDQPLDGEPRFGMLETIRDHAIERLADSGETDQMRDRHASYYLSQSEQAEVGLTGPGQVAWLDRLERDHNNLRAALSWAIERGNADLGLRLGGVLWRFWWLRGYLHEGRVWIESLLTLNATAVQPGVRAKALVSAGLLALWQGDYVAARTLLEQSLRLARAVGAEREVAYGLTFLTRVGRDQGQEKAAAFAGAESVDLFRQIGDRWGLALALHFLGLAEERLDAAAARLRFEESAALFRALGARWDLAMPLRGLGLVAYQRGDFAAARSFFEESAALFRERADEWSVAMLLPGLGHVALHQGAPAQAHRRFAESLRLWQDLGNPRGIALGLSGLAAVAAVEGQTLRAARLFGAAEKVLVEHLLVLEPTDRADHDRYVALARAKGRAERFAQEGAEGRAMGQTDAISYALEPRAEAGGAARGREELPPSALHPLTPREQEVALLVASGLGNRQIAERLIVTERTIETHVTHILAKLSVSSRAHLAAWTARRVPLP